MSGRPVLLLGPTHELHQATVMKNGSSSESRDADDCYDLQDAPEWVLILQTLALSFIVLASLIGNGLVLILVAKYKKLRRRSFVVGFSMIVADLAFVVTFHLPSVVSLAFTRWPLSDVACTVAAIVSQYCLITRWYIMAVLAIDRFCNVRFPFSYEKHSRAIISVLTLVAWVLPLFIVAPNLALADTNFRQNIASCRFDCTGAKPGCNGYTALMWTSAFTIGGGLPTLLYLWLYRQARRLRATSTVTLGQMAVRIASGVIVSQPIAPVERRFIELQGVITFTLMFITFIVTGLPAYSFLITRSANPELWCKIPIYVHFIALQLILSSTFWDPFVIMRDKDFRNCLKDFVRSCMVHRRRKLTLSASAPKPLTDVSNGLSSNTFSHNGNCSNGHSGNGEMLTTLKLGTSPVDTA